MASNKNGMSRRTIIQCGVAVAAAGVGMSTVVRAQTKIPPESVMYVAMTANPEQFCSDCLHWQGTPHTTLDEAKSSGDSAECAIVAGQVVATGWCGVWAPRG